MSLSPKDFSACDDIAEAACGSTLGDPSDSLCHSVFSSSLLFFQAILAALNDRGSDLLQDVDFRLTSELLSQFLIYIVLYIYTLFLLYMDQKYPYVVN